MRIIAGIHRGRTIVGPKNAETTRPITDRVKTTLFDRLCQGMHLIGADDDDGGLVLDIFAGTGTLGIEALSRGAERCIFVEQDRDALNRLKRNLGDLRLNDQAEVLPVNALRPGWVEQLPAPFPGRVRVTFLDPPYALSRDPDGMARLLPLMQTLANATEPGGVLVLRTEKQVDPPPVPGWAGPEARKYGSMKLSFYYREPPAAPDAPEAAAAPEGQPQ